MIYIDELDAFGDRARPRDHNSSYTDYIITGRLDLIDGFHDHQGGLVIGATNHNRPLPAEIVEVLGETGLLSGPRLADLLSRVVPDHRDEPVGGGRTLPRTGWPEQDRGSLWDSEQAG